MILQIPIIDNTAVQEGISGVTNYVMPIVAVLAVMLIIGLRIVKLDGTMIDKYRIYIVLITTLLMAIGIVLKLLPEEISELIISGISTIIFVLFIIQLMIQLKFKKKA